MGSGLSVLSSGFWVLSIEPSLFPIPYSLFPIPYSPLAFTDVSRVIGFFGVLQPFRKSPGEDGRQSLFEDGGAGLGVVVLNFAEFGLLGIRVVDNVSGIGPTMAGLANGTCIDDALEGG